MTPAADLPLVRLRASRGLPSLDIPELLQYRELLLFLAWRDLKVRYQQTALGIAWIALQPLLMAAVFVLVLGRLSPAVSTGVPYPAFVLTGVVAWTHFAATLTGVVSSLVSNATLLTKVYFPRLVLPAAAALARLADLGIGLLVVAGLLAWYGISPGSSIVWLPAAILLSVLLALGLGLWLSLVNLRYRDIGHTLPFLLQVWMFTTPVVYPAAWVTGRARAFLHLNPATGVLTAYRAALLGEPADVRSFLTSAMLALLVLLPALFVFRRHEKSFADVV